MAEAAIGFIADPVGDPFVRRAILEVALIGLIGGALGPWLISFDLGYAAESTAHAMLPGLVIAVLVGVPLVIGGLAGLAAAALAIAAATRVARMSGEVAVAISVTTLFGLGGLLALSAQTPAGLGELLFGDVLAVDDGQLALAASLAALTLAVLWLAHHRLLATGFDPSSAAALGISRSRVELLVLALMAIALLVAVQGLGSLLAVAILLAPAAVARELSGRMSAVIAIAVAVGIGSGVAGLYISFHAGSAAGASIALAAVGAYAAATIAARLGLLTRMGIRAAPLR